MNKFIVHKYEFIRLTRYTFYPFWKEYGENPNKYLKSVPLVTVEVWCDKDQLMITSHYTTNNDVQYFVDLWNFVKETIEELTCND